MVVTMPSAKSKASKTTDQNLSTEIRFPVFTESQKEHWPSQMSWEEAVQSFAAVREHYLLNFDSPEERLRQKNPEPFRL
jgi:hypothetical protein